MLCSDQNASTSLKFTYTPMHGVGYPFFAEAMKVFGFAPCITVVEQVVAAMTVMCCLIGVNLFEIQKCQVQCQGQ